MKSFFKQSNRFKGRFALWIVCLSFIHPGFSVGASEYFIFQLKDGTLVKGLLVKEQAEAFLVQVGEGGITGETLIAKTKISKKTKVPDDEVAMMKMPPMEIHPRHTYELKDYASGLKAADDFLKKFPQSAYAPIIKEKRTLWNKEMDRVSKGEIKSGGEWFGASQARILSYDIQASLIYDEIIDAAGENNFSLALYYFDDLQTRYPFSQAYYQAGIMIMEMLDRNIKGKDNEIISLERRVGQLEKTRALYNSRILDTQRQMTGASPNFISKLRNQADSMQSHLKKTESEIKNWRDRVDEAKGLRTLYLNRLTELQKTPFESLIVHSDRIKVIEEKFASGKMNEVRNLLALPEYNRFERAKIIRTSLQEHDKILQDIQNEIKSKNYDMAIDKGSDALKKFPNSEQIDHLINEARSARSDFGAAQN